MKQNDDFIQNKALTENNNNIFFEIENEFENAIENKVENEIENGIEDEVENENKKEIENEVENENKNVIEDEIENPKIFYTDSSDENKRLDVFLSENLPDFSRSFIQKLIKKGEVLVNGKVEKSKYLLKKNQEVKISIEISSKINIEPQNIPVEIVYEDEDIIVVNKEQGMVVHMGAGNYDGTLVNALLYHTNGKLSSYNEDDKRPGIVHRIDKDTSGLLVVCKTNKAHKILAEKFSTHDIKREYHFICNGILNESVTVNANIGRNPNDRLKMAVVPNGKRAITHFEPIKIFDKYTYAKATLETGRTHQIRVHSAYIKHPLLGDKVYGNKNEKIKANGQTLHAKTLGFVHPTKNIYMEFNSELPEYFKELLKKIN
ncbi:MAG: RluA family pseudouridine synthase [Clostridioides sp.]|jgi:23S rRNA pseudouridine1911/1915/1917 synthase|nr:RluA family pseudouridine synthase [Clostridioides sp.]